LTTASIPVSTTPLLTTTTAPLSTTTTTTPIQVIPESKRLPKGGFFIPDVGMGLFSFQIVFLSIFNHELIIILNYYFFFPEIEEEQQEKGNYIIFECLFSYYFVFSYYFFKNYCFLFE
jgi:hypothetical protein